MDLRLAVVFFVLWGALLGLRRRHIALRERRERNFRVLMRRRRQRRGRQVICVCYIYCDTYGILLHVLCSHPLREKCAIVMSSLYIQSVYSRLVLALLAAHSTRGLRRRIWCKPRCREWWQTVNSGVFGQRWWKENLRMSQATFMYICNKLRPTIEKQVCIYNIMCIIITLCYVILLYVSYYYRLLNYASQCLLKRGLR